MHILHETEEKAEANHYRKYEQQSESCVPNTGFWFWKSLLRVARTSVLSSDQCARTWWAGVNSTGPLPDLFFLGFGPSLRHVTSRHIRPPWHLGLPLLSPCSSHLIQGQIWILHPPLPPTLKLKRLSVSNLPQSPQLLCPQWSFLVWRQVSVITALVTNTSPQRPN